MRSLFQTVQPNLLELQVRLLCTSPYQACREVMLAAIHLVQQLQDAWPRHGPHHHRPFLNTH
jgi:hypothetical protein